MPTPKSDTERAQEFYADALQQSDVEEELWDQLFDTDAMRSCSCPSCNHYLPPGEYKPDMPCEVVSLIYKIIYAREERVRAGA